MRDCEIISRLLHIFVCGSDSSIIMAFLHVPQFHSCSSHEAWTTELRLGSRWSLCHLVALPSFVVRKSHFISRYLVGEYAVPVVGQAARRSDNCRCTYENTTRPVDPQPRIGNESATAVWSNLKGDLEVESLDFAAEKRRYNASKGALFGRLPERAGSQTG